MAMPVSALFGVGKTIAKKLNDLNIETARDLIFYYPRRFDDFSAILPIEQLTPGMTATIVGTVQLISNRRSRSKKIVTTAMIADASGATKAIWFNQPFIAKNLPVGTRVRLSGKTSDTLFDLSLVNPSYEKIGAASQGIHTGRLVPVYPLTSGISQKQFRMFVKSALDCCLHAIPDGLPEQIRAELSLLPLHAALSAIHFPASGEEWARARRRLAFDELLTLQVIQRRAKKMLESQLAHSIPFDQKSQERLSARLPFALTGSQKKALAELAADMARTTPMNRLLEGDVGSGKTVVSALAAAAAAGWGLQAAYLAPTEILAAQTYESYLKLFAGSGISITLLTSAVIARSDPPAGGDEPSEPVAETGLLRFARNDKKTRTETLKAIANGDIHIIIGTHALLEQRVQFQHLGIAIVDEQHRFGVEQRKTLREKNSNGFMPHLLSMTATPIPRSLALTVYGDLDISIIDALPLGRKKIVTKVVPANYRSWTYDFIRRQITIGRQVFVICPMIEPSDVSGARSVKAEYARLLAEVFPEMRLGMLYGKMPTEKKSAVMRAMLEGTIDILVATSVVEVGIDIPNATVMLIEGAERFGLAQLHQFRGRVGRSTHQSYCFLLPTTEEKEETVRLRALVKSNNGFELAEADLRDRGAGDVLGKRQSGLPSLKIATLADHDLIAASRKWAERIVGEPQYSGFLESIGKGEVHLE